MKSENFAKSDFRKGQKYSKAELTEIIGGCYFSKSLKNKYQKNDLVGFRMVLLEVFVLEFSHNRFNHIYFWEIPKNNNPWWLLSKFSFGVLLTFSKSLFAKFSLFKKKKSAFFLLAPNTIWGSLILFCYIKVFQLSSDVRKWLEGHLESRRINPGRWRKPYDRSAQISLINIQEKTANSLKIPLNSNPQKHAKFAC